MHQRRLIREAVKAALIGVAPTYATAAQARVYETRVFEWRISELPGISVYSLEEPVDPKSGQTAPMELTRDLDLAIEAAVVATANIDDAIDDMCEQIERAMHVDDSFGGTCSYSLLKNTEIEVVANNEKLIGMARLIYSVRYYTYAPEAADTVLQPFTSGGVEIKVEGPTQADEDAVQSEITPAQ